MRRLVLLLSCFIIMFSYTDVYANIMVQLVKLVLIVIVDAVLGMVVVHQKAVILVVIVLVETILILDLMYMDALILMLLTIIVVLIKMMVVALLKY